MSVNAGARRGAIAAVVALMTAAGPAAAWNFDEATGRLDTAGADFAFSFDDLDSLPEGHDLILLNPDWRPMNPGAVEGYFEADEEGLEGAGAFVFGGESIQMILTLAPLAERFAGRRVEVRLWQQPRGTRATLDLVWQIVPDTPAQASVRLHQTGRVTDDGWEEWSTGPIDWQAAGAVPPTFLIAYDAQVVMTGAWLARFDDSSSVRLDALEIADLGPAAVPAASCSALDEETACGDDGVCLVGRCIDAALIVGAAPTTNAGIRDDYIDRRVFEYRTFEGGRLPRERSAVLAEMMDGLRDELSREFWPTFGDAVEQLRDGHASAAAVTPRLPFSTGACLHLGEADLIEGGGRLPLVFSVSGRDPLSEVLQEGDALLEIDGVPPAEWARTATRLVRFTGDPEAFDVVVTPSLVGAAAAAGSVLTFGRCDRPEPDAAPCAADEVERFSVDLGDLWGEALFGGALPDWMLDEPPVCDFRFRRALDDHDVTDYAYAGAADEGGVTTLLINGVPSYWEEGGREWFDTVAEACIPPPEVGLILDQRTGHGGAIGTTDYLAATLVGSGDFFAMDLFPTIDQDFTEEVHDDLVACMLSRRSNCGGAFRWVLGATADRPPTRNRADETPLAILDGLDVSGNDYATRLLLHRTGPTRIFGPAPTWGAFGPIYSMPSHFDELSGGSMQWHDTLFFATAADAQDIGEAQFATGSGVPPQELIFQRQSDILRGVDTLVEAARAWLAEVGS